MEENKTAKCEPTSKINFLLGLFVGMAAISVIGFFAMLIVVFSNGQPIDQSAKAENNPPVVADKNNGGGEEEINDKLVPPVADGELFLGGKNARVVLIEYTDFECPFCLKHHDTANKLLAEYGNKIKYVLRHFPLPFHENAMKAAEAAECAGEQGKFWEMEKALFKSNEAGNMGVAAFREIAKSLKLNMDKFNNCLDNGKYVEKINSAKQGGAEAGVRGTPATFINGQLVSGALPIDSFKQTIDGLLK